MARKIKENVVEGRREVDSLPFNRVSRPGKWWQLVKFGKGWLVIKINVPMKNQLTIEKSVYKFIKCTTVQCCYPMLYTVTKYLQNTVYICPQWNLQREQPYNMLKWSTVNFIRWNKCNFKKKFKKKWHEKPFIHLEIYNQFRSYNLIYLGISRKNEKKTLEMIIMSQTWSKNKDEDKSYITR